MFSHSIILFVSIIVSILWFVRKKKFVLLFWEFCRLVEETGDSDGRLEDIGIVTQQIGDVLSSIRD